MRFSLDRTDIWDKTKSTEQREDFTYENLVSLAKEGNVKKIREIFDAPYYYPNPYKTSCGKNYYPFSAYKRRGSFQSFSWKSCGRNEAWR